MGLGSRHLAAASISKVTRAIAIVVSESAVVRIFEGGTLIGDIIPELWLLNQEHVFGKSNRSARLTKSRFPLRDL
jgi:diadenylate cyclase